MKKIVDTALGSSQIRRIVMLSMVGVTAKALSDIIPPRARSADADAQTFSAKRAAKHLPYLARGPHPAGSPACREVAEYLIKALKDLGLDVRSTCDKINKVYTDTTAILARVQNVYARIPGHSSTGQILLVAHYDSVWTSSGASDNAASVCALLELARLLCAGPRPRNDIGILFTDAEEHGCLGARAFIRGMDADPESTLVINFEYRGVAGPAVMFETSDDSAAVLEQFARAPRPVATSLSSTIYRMLAADTDLTEFLKAGYRGLNFAAIFGSSYYHTSRDTTENVDLATLQHHGSSAEAILAGLKDRDLTALPRSEPQTYFTALGRLIHYPNRFTLPLAAVAVGGYLAGAARMRSRGLRPGRAAAAALAVPAAMAVSWGIGKGAWKALTWLRLDYRSQVTGDVYRGAAYRTGLAVAATATAAGVSSLARRWTSDEEYLAGTWAWPAIAAGVTPFLLPGGSYLFAWPLIGGGLALNAALASNDGVRLASWTYGMVGLPLWAPLVTLMFPVLGLAQAPLALAAAGHLVPLIAPAISERLGVRGPASRAWWLGAVGGAALVGAGALLDRFDDRHPRQISLAYVLDCNAKVARWVSADPVPNPLTSKFVGAEMFHLEELVPNINRGFSPAYRTGMGEVHPIPEPELTAVRSEEIGERRILEMRLRAPVNILSIAMYAEIDRDDLHEVTVDGWPITPQPNRVWSNSPWKWGFAFYEIPDEGIDIRLVLNRQGPVNFRVVMYRRGLPEPAGLDTLPDDLAWAATLSNITVAVKSVEM